ncbi:MAG TPA: hypothetical protein VFB60_18345 [Ktedonobacteraceae bacterium]|nr:hypothetical protein [Ktedonobacteraceae bacterium]
MHNVEISPVPTLRLSRTELYVLIRLLKASGIAGIDFTWFQIPPVDLPRETLVRTVDEAVKSLVARGYLVPLPEGSNGPLSFTSYMDQESGQQNWKKVGIPEELATLLSTCTFPAQSLALTWRTSRGAELLWLHTLDEVIVAVTSPLPDIYQFMVLPSWDTAQLIILEALGIKEQQAPRQPLPIGRLQANVLPLARKALEINDPAQALSQLTGAGLPEPTALAFLEAIGACTTLARVVVTSQGPEPDGHAQRAKLVAIITPTICFVLSPPDASEEAYTVRAMSADEVRAWITAAWSAQVATRQRATAGSASNWDLPT